MAKKRDCNGLTWDQRNTIARRLRREASGSPQGNQWCAKAPYVPRVSPVDYVKRNRDSLYACWWDFDVKDCDLCGRMFVWTNASRIRDNMPNRYPRVRRSAGFLDYFVCNRSKCRQLVTLASDCVGTDAAKAGIKLLEVRPWQVCGNAGTIMIRAALRAATTSKRVTP